MKKILDFTLFGDNTALKDEFGRVVTYQMLEEWLHLMYYCPIFLGMLELTQHKCTPS